MTDERVPGAGKYARIERERRWLVSLVPPHAEFVGEITDHYIAGTTLRVRKISSDSTTTWKLTQKVRLNVDDPEFVKTTTMYLSQDEYRLITNVDAHVLRKTRHHLLHEGHRFAVDVFDGRHVGLVVVEIELGVDEPVPVAPLVAAKDVTRDGRYCGASLASASDQQIRALIAGSTT